MEFRRFEVEGPLEIVPRKIEDKRGYFSEIFRLDAFTAKVGSIEFVQDNQSLSLRAGTIRGIHFQTRPRAQGKLVRCLSGSALDIAVDLRRDSPTYGKWISAVLTPGPPIDRCRRSAQCRERDCRTMGWPGLSIPTRPHWQLGRDGR